MEDTDDDILALFQEGHEDHRSRKRKLDKDGFVCPTAPNIPKTSHQFVEKRHHSSFNGLDCVSSFPTFGDDFVQTDTESVSSYFKEGVDSFSFQTSNEDTSFQVGVDNPSFEPMADKIPFEMGDNQSANIESVNDPSQGHARIEGSLGFDSEEDNSSFQPEDEIVDNPGAYNADKSQYEADGNKHVYQTQSHLPNEEGAATQESTHNLLQSIIKGFEQESAAVFDQWSKIFRQSGEYELLCQQKLDNMIQDARTIDHTMNSKKDVLCNRLKGIGKTLET